jgi:hypothetical protein
MIRHKAQDFDNRDSGQVYEYLEARIEVMKRRIVELEKENARLSELCSPTNQLAVSA